MNDFINNLIIIGYSGHALVVADAAFSRGGTIAGYCDNVEKNNDHFGLKYLGKESSEILNDRPWIIGIGDNKIREKIYQDFRNAGQVTSVIHKSAIVGSGVTIGDGTLLAANAIINPLAKVGLCSIINTGAIVEHECVVGDFVHIAPGAVLAGNVNVGHGSFIGANAVVKQGVTIGKNVIVGAGSVILKNVTDNCTVVGNPGKAIK